VAVTTAAAAAAAAAAAVTALRLLAHLTAVLKLTAASLRQLQQGCLQTLLIQKMSLGTQCAANLPAAVTV
jgi:hypothetical protein